MTTAAATSSVDAARAVRGGVRAEGYRIAVVIVHYKTPGMLLECVESLLPQLKGAEDHVFVVDNASGAEHVAGLAKLRAFPQVTLMESETNLGFAGANNVALRRVMEDCGAEYYLLLNPDTILRPGAVETLVEFLERNPQAACVGPRLEDPDGTAQQSAFRNPSPVSEFLRGASIGPIERVFKGWQVYGPIIEQAQATDWLAGACVLMRSEMVTKTGLLDDQFFMYYEEVDYFRHAKGLGFQAWYEPKAHVVHLVGAASGVKRSGEQKRLPAYWFASRQRYFRKHYGWAGALLADWLWVNGHVLDRVRKLVTGTSHAAVAKGELGDLIRHSLRQLVHPFKTSPRRGGGAV